MKQMNFQSELHFDFQIAKLPNVPLFVQAVQLPGVMTEPPQTATQFSPLKHIGDTLFFPDLIVSLKLDEQMESWYEMFKWLSGLTRPESWQQFRDLVGGDMKSLDESKPLFRAKEFDPNQKGYKNTKSTASLRISDSNYLPYMEIVFMDLHPVSLGGFVFQTVSPNVEFITFDVEFAYNFYFPRPAR
jgi:hypothetical protein